MAIAWFIVPYKRLLDRSKPIRYCAMDDFTSQILADNGWWEETEVLGDRAIVKVKANVSTLNTISNIVGFRRLPKVALNMPLSDLTIVQKEFLRNELLDQGYTLSELQTRFGNDLGKYTLGDVLRFMTSRRLKPRYDSQTDTIILDGTAQPCRSVDLVDQAVQ